MIVRLAGLVLAALVVLLAAATPAAAHHVDVSATVSCSGTVTFTATAWRSTSAAGRTNTDVRVSYSTDGHRFLTLPAKPAYAFGSANQFTFADRFQLGRPLPRFVVVAAQAAVAWSDRAKAGAVHTTGRLLVPRCPARPATPIPARTAPRSTPTTSPTSVAPPTSAPMRSPAGPPALRKELANTTASGGSSVSIGVIAPGAALFAVLVGAGVWALRRARRV